MNVERLVRANGIELFIHELGPDKGGEPPLVVIHGGPDWDHSYLLPGIELVAKSRHVVMFDMRGCGRSTSGLGDDCYQPELVVEDLQHLLTALGHDVVDLLGFSTGGQVAQLFVAGHGDVVRRLVLASTTAYPDVTRYLEGWVEAARRDCIRPDRPAWATCPKPKDPQGAALTAEWAIDAAPSSIWNLNRLEEYFDLLGRVRFGGEWIGPLLNGTLHSWRPADPQQTLRDFARPVLVLHGAQDMAFPVQLAERLAAAVPNAELRVIPRAGHMAHFDQSREWASWVVQFLKPLTAGGYQGGTSSES